MSPLSSLRLRCGPAYVMLEATGDAGRFRVEVAGEGCLAVDPAVELAALELFQNDLDRARSLVFERTEHLRELLGLPLKRRVGSQR